MAGKNKKIQIEKQNKIGYKTEKIIFETVDIKWESKYKP